MKNILSIGFLLASLTVSAQDGPKYEYLLEVTGIESAEKCKTLYSVLHDLDPDILISHSDDFNEIKLRSNIRFDLRDLQIALAPYGISVLDLGLRSAGSSNNDPPIITNDN